MSQAAVDLAAMQDSLLDTITSYRPHRGEPTMVTDRMIEAYRATPRHDFVRTFRLIGDPQTSAPRQRDSASSLDLIYTNQPLMYVGRQGETLPASNSEPAFIFHLLSLLGVEPGQRVLEIGCGTGWLLSIIGRMVGSHGTAVGVEIIEEIGRQAMENVARTGLRNTRVVVGDAMQVLPTLGAFDRIIFTASTFELPDQLFDAVSPGGRVVVPLRNRGLAEEVFVLERTARGFESVTARLCKFVPLVAQGVADPSGIRPPPSGGPWGKIADALRSRYAFPLSSGDRMRQLYTALPFSSFLSKRDSQFHVFSIAQGAHSMGLHGATFGDPDSLALALIRDAETSAVLWNRGELSVYGKSDVAATDFSDLFAQWKSLGSPHGSDFRLAVTRRSEALAVGTWKEQRGPHDFHWSLRQARADRAPP